MRMARVRFPSNLWGFVSDEWHWNKSLPEDLIFSCQYQFLSVAVCQCSILAFISVLVPSQEQSEKRGNLHTKWSFGARNRFLGTIAKLRNAPLSFVMSVRLSCQQVLAWFPLDRFPWDFDTGDFYENKSWNSQFG